MTNEMNPADDTGFDDDTATDEQEIAALLEQLASGEDNAADQLMPLVYDRLRGLAQKMLRNESPSHTLQPTALVNEAYLRIRRKMLDLPARPRREIRWT